MSTNNLYLAVFLGSRSGAQVAAWEALSESARAARQQEGMAAWGAWMTKHRAAILEAGGPLGKTKQVTKRGIADVSNAMSAFALVRADSHEAAAKMFENHPHFTIFPGDGVEVMPILPIPGTQNDQS
jgi:hypothetical protein